MPGIAHFLRSIGLDPHGKPLSESELVTEPAPVASRPAPLISPDEVAQLIQLVNQARGSLREEIGKLYGPESEQPEPTQADRDAETIAASDTSTTEARQRLAGAIVRALRGGGEQSGN
jgi:hypothetical protein